MARKARLFVPNAIYHVYCRTARGERVFAAEPEAEAFVEILRTIRDTDQLTILAWCLMGNHHHVVLRTADVPLWSSMARLQGRIARGFNRRHGYFGRLWQSRYKARVVDSERYFNQVVAYVHRNPVTAGLVEDPAEYAWSGHGAMIGRIAPRLVDVRAVLRGYGRTIADARRNYLASVRAVAEERWLGCGLRELPWWVETKDADVIVEPHEHPHVVGYDGQPHSSEQPRIELEELVQLYAQHQGVRLEDLAGTGRTSTVIEARILLTAVAVQRFGLAVNEVARFLDKNAGTVSRWLGIARERGHTNAAFSSQLETTTKVIVRLHNAIK